MNMKWLYGAAIAAVTAISVISISGSTSDRAASMEHKNDGFDVQADFGIAQELLAKHFPNSSAYHGPSFDNFGTMYIDNEANQYVFLLDDTGTAKAQYFIRDVKAKLGAHVVIKQARIPYKKLRAIQEEIVKTYEKQFVLESVGVDIIHQKVEVEGNFTEEMTQSILQKYGADVVNIEIYDPGAIANNQIDFIANMLEPVQQIGGPNDKMYWPPHEGLYYSEEGAKALDDEVYAKTGFPRYNGKLLEKYGLYSHQSGEALPKGNLVFGINRLPEGMKTRIRLTELDYPSLKPAREISNVTFDKPHGMKVNFPDRIDAIYALRLELLNAAEETVDGKVIIYAFEADEINARMETDRKTYKPSDTVKIKLINWGPTTLSYGSWFGVQQWVSGKWMWLNGGKNFTAEMRGLSPGEEAEEKHSLEWLSLEPGQYRIVKSIGGGLAAPFEVVAE